MLDDAYAPFGPLEAIGALPAFAADVVAQPVGEPGFHRIGIVRYPSRAKFFEMQQGGLEVRVMNVSPPRSGLGGSQVVAALSLWALLTAFTDKMDRPTEAEFFAIFYKVMDIEQELGIGGGLQDDRCRRRHLPSISPWS